MPTTKYQLKYWQNVCDNCVLGPTIADCIRPDDMSTRRDPIYARRGCLLACARENDIEPEAVTDAVQVGYRLDDSGGVVIMLARNEATCEAA